METDTTEALDSRGARFVTSSWRRIIVVAGALLVLLLVLRVSTDAIRAHRAVRLAIETLDEQIRAADEKTAVQQALEVQVEELRERRADLRAHVFEGDARPQLEPRFDQFCEQAEVSQESLTAFRPGIRGALQTYPYQLSFAGNRHQVPILLDLFYTQEEVMAVTGIELEVVNFIDDRITGTLDFEIFGLREPHAATGEILREFLPAQPPRAAAGALGRLDGSFQVLEETRARLESRSPGLLDHETFTVTYAHYQAETTELHALMDGHAAAQADVARALPRLERALTRSALGRAGFKVVPGGAVEMLVWD